MSDFYADEQVIEAVVKVVNEVPEAFVSRAHIADLTLRTVAPFVMAREESAHAEGERAAIAERDRLTETLRLRSEALDRVVAENEDMRLLVDDLRATHRADLAALAAVEALAERWAAADGEPARCCDLTIMNVCNRHGRELVAILRGES